MYSFSIANNKGGVGKTTLSVSIAAELAKKGRVLLIDCDPQGNTTGSLLKSYNHEFADVLFGKCTAEEAIMETEFPNLYVMPTVSLDTSNPNSLNQLRLYKSTLAANNPNAIRKIVKSLADKFDYCVFDTCPAFDPFEENIMAACDEVITVMLMDVFSVDGLTIFKENLRDFKERKEMENPKFSKIILNSCNKSITLHKKILEEMDKQENFDCFVVPQDQAFKRAQSIQKPIQYLTKEEGEGKQETLEALSVIANNL